MNLTKREVRAKALAGRDGIPPEVRRAYSGEIVRKLTSHACYRKACAVLTYVNCRSEVETLPLIGQTLADGKAVFAPRVAGREMEFFQIMSVGDLEEGYRGIFEPAGHIEASFAEWGREGSVLVCLPGAAFDRARHRIGYGGGFYDRYLSRLAEEGSGRDGLRISTAALAYGCQIFDEIPWEAHDVRPERIVTEKEIF